MSDRIGGYRLLTAMHTAGSGSARWCMAERGKERFFLKEFLSPVWPANTQTLIGQRQIERCRRFEEKKQRLYAAASCVLGDALIPVIDFFRENGHYYAVSEAAPEACLTAENADKLNDQEKRALLYELALGLQRLHAQGIVHADLKPEHVFLLPYEGGWKPRIIDLDSGFLADDPPRNEREMEGDPVYLAPEMFLRMCGQQAALGTEADVFAFGAMIHQIWTGRLPGFDQQFHYLYEAVLEGAEIRLELPQEWQATVAGMLNADPAKRPPDAQITAVFAPKPAPKSSPAALNGLSRLMKI